MTFSFYIYYAGENEEIVYWIKEFQNTLYSKTFKETQVVLNIKNVAGIRNCFINEEINTPLQFCISSKCMYFIIDKEFDGSLSPVDVYDNVIGKVIMSDIKVGTIGM